MADQKNNKTEDQKILDDVLGDIPGVFTAPDSLKVLDTSMETWLTGNILDASPAKTIVKQVPTPTPVQEVKTVPNVPEAGTGI